MEMGLLRYLRTILRCRACFAEDVGGGFVGEAEIFGDIGAVLHLEEDHGRGNEHAAEKQTPTGGEFGHVGGLLGVEAAHTSEKEPGGIWIDTYRHIPAAPAD